MNGNYRSETLFLTISHDLQMVDEILKKAIATSDLPLIREVAEHIVFSGGKRFRPALAILSAKICGFSGENAHYLGAAIELIHTASLIHDDVMDNADLRRGRQTANSKWGNHLSILVGDFCYSLAGQLLAEKTSLGIMALMTEGAKNTTEGEVLEVINSNDVSMSYDTYMKIIHQKTACLIAASCESGGMVADAPDRLSKALGQYGASIGIAFQIIDDILDFTAVNGKFGKNKGTDLKEGKLTLPLIYALAKATASEKSIIKEALIAPTSTDDGFNAVLDILNKYDSLNEAKRTAERYISEAKASLSPFKESLEKETLIQFANFVTSREL